MASDGYTIIEIFKIITTAQCGLVASCPAFFIRKVSGSNFRSYPAYFYLRFFSLLSVSKQTARQYLKSGHDQFQPFPYKFIFYQPSPFDV
jgi:hypothetical protein